jgi:hypothetical protein
VAKKTRPRGSGNTSPWPFRWAILAALVFHLPLLPTTLFAWLDLVLGKRELPPEEPPGELYLPIELDLEPTATAAAAPAPLPEDDVVGEAAPTAPPTPPKPAPKKEPAIVDAGVIDAAPDADVLDAADDADVLDAGARADAGDPDAAAPNEAGAPWPPRLDGGPLGPPGLPTDAGSPADAGPDAAEVSDPQRVAGDASRVIAPSNNVSLTIAADVIREHELGSRFASLLTSIPQWKAFFDGTGIDPIRDVDHVYITGPQFRDTTRVVAVLGYNVAPGKIRAALGKVMARSDPPGEWLKDAPLPTARARVQGKERLFVHLAEKKLLVVMPPELEKQIGELKKRKPFPKSTNIGISASTITPARALREVPLRIPPSLTKLVVNVIPTKDGGADVELDATDASAEAAARSAADLNTQIETARVISVAGLFRKELFAPLVFRVEGTHLRGSTHVGRSEIAYVLGTFDRTVKDRQTADENKASDGGALPP